MSAALSVPGPAPSFLLGKNGNLLRFLVDPLEYIGQTFARYGKIAVLVNGRTTRLVSTKSSPGTVFLYGPELNRALLTGHGEFHKCALSGPLYPAGAITERTRPLTRMLTGLFDVNDLEHRQHRRLLMPAFHKGRIETYRDQMVAITESVLAQIQPGAVRDVCPDMMELTLRVATKTLFGADFGSEALEIGRSLHEWLGLFRRGAILPWDAPFLPYRRWLDISHVIDRKMVAVLAEKRQSGPGTDMLSMLLEATDETGAKLSEDELIGHAGVIFAAGHETSSNALSWTLFLLSQHPEIMSDLFEELDGLLKGDAPSLEQLPKLTLLDHVVKESLRLLPPVPLNHRIVGKETELGGYALPPGTEILASIYHTHRMPEYFSEPSRFLPSRWARLDPGPYVYNPFSAGPRMCIGATFALMEIKIVLALWLQRFRFELVANSRVDRFMSITMSPRPGLPMKIHAQDRSFARSARRVRGNVRQMVNLDAAC